MTVQLDRGRAITVAQIEKWEKNSPFVGREAS
jgi:hypothetical protein